MQHGASRTSDGRTSIRVVPARVSLIGPAVSLQRDCSGSFLEFANSSCAARIWSVLCARSRRALSATSSPRAVVASQLSRTRFSGLRFASIVSSPYFGYNYRGWASTNAPDETRIHHTVTVESGRTLELSQVGTSHQDEL